MSDVEKADGWELLFDGTSTYGWREYNQGKTDRNLDILAEYTKLDRELLKEACWAKMRNDGRINVESILDFQTWAVKKGFLEKEVTGEQYSRYLADAQDFVNAMKFIVEQRPSDSDKKQ